VAALLRLEKGCCLDRLDPRGVGGLLKKTKYNPTSVNKKSRGILNVDNEKYLGAD
jgi:hypothetical protein